MQKINFYTCLLFVLLAVNIGFAQGNRLQFKNLSLDDGLSQSFVGSIAQDDKGFLWIGTQDGLNKFDGFSFSTFGKTLFDKKIFGWVNDVCSYKNDTSNFLWVATNFVI